MIHNDLYSIEHNVEKMVQMTDQSCPRQFVQLVYLKRKK